jgi:hypothetical protein
MEFTPLSELKRHDINVVVRVCVVTKWDFRGMADSGPIQHMDMVLADKKVCLVHSRQPLLLKPNHNYLSDAVQKKTYDLVT